ncbi:hypothetical protein G6L91_30465 [Agrobacterium rhizogenes]|nr:hypothetical protein [Rhizobium rhizogenes]NTF97943.1 hypothetical protein [Rhizobium rhizogenes]NTG97173.1 hypothetical protein [Rhizobium rhizogenes]
MNILHIDSSITGENSISRQLSASTISNILKVHPDAHVVYRDLVAAPLDHYRIPGVSGRSSP